MSIEEQFWGKLSSNVVAKNAPKIKEVNEFPKTPEKYLIELYCWGINQDGVLVGFNTSRYNIRFYEMFSLKNSKGGPIFLAKEKFSERSFLLKLKQSAFTWKFTVNIFDSLGGIYYSNRDLLDMIEDS